MFRLFPWLYITVLLCLLICRVFRCVVCFHSFDAVVIRDVSSHRSLDQHRLHRWRNCCCTDHCYYIFLPSKAKWRSTWGAKVSLTLRRENNDIPFNGILFIMSSLYLFQQYSSHMISSIVFCIFVGLISNALVFFQINLPWLVNGDIWALKQTCHSEQILSLKLFIINNCLRTS